MPRIIGRSGRWSGEPGSSEDTETSVVELRVPVSTILKVLLTALIVWAVLKLIPEFLFFLLALLLAISIAPLVSRLERRGVKRGMAVVIVAVLTVLTALVFLFLVGPPLVSQLMALFEHFPEYQRRVQGRIAPGHPMI